MDLGLKDKIAFVTASSQGLGKAVALQLAQEQAKVIICARRRNKLLQAKREIEQKTATTVRAIRLDVTEEKQVAKTVDMISQEFAAIDILVSNAGGPAAGMFEDFGPEDYKQALELNLLSTIKLCYEVVPIMKKQKSGRIINMTSVSVKQPIDNLILSNTSRTGIIGFSKSLSNQVAKHGITVNAVCPGYTKTQRVEGLAQAYAAAGKGSVAEFYDKIERNIPAGRLGTPKEFAAAVAFLASDQAAYINGVSLQIDGGFVKGLF